ncbi:hypothetical protein [Sporomusa malonica]|uniref:Uncharacterized protein n=1 Tax=Sporomusa malonica TaxID=112901 RepID=A0A1W2ANX2_9FIRM|nr:hypothetical protein [Sporomusa malonica]SMC62385.1 hypothetical protein SAMN04488500_1065 [Sporomusa malonica]
MCDAKARICVYGSKEIIECLAEFWRKGANMKSIESKAVFIRLIQCMRNETELRSAIDDIDISQLIFGQDIQSNALCQKEHI